MHTVKRATSEAGQSIWKQLKPNVLYVDRGVLVVNKPPGLVCQLDSKSRREHQPEHESFNELLHKLKTAYDMPTIPFQVHRLDKGTTGALLFARTIELARELSRQFQMRTIEKTYLALVRGGEKSFPSSHGEIRDALRIEDGRVSRVPLTSPGGQTAATDWEVISSSQKAPISLVRLRLHTGLKHQLRVHMATSLHTPIVGDNVYSRKKLIATEATHIPTDRIFLHASHVSFFRYHKAGPNRRFRLGITAPLPEDFKRICSELRIQVGDLEANGGISIDGNPVTSTEFHDISGP